MHRPSVREWTLFLMTNDERRETNDERRGTNDERRGTNDERRGTRGELYGQEILAKDNHLLLEYVI